MPDFTLPQFIGILAAAANIGIAIMIILLLGERSHAAWTGCACAPRNSLP